MIHNTSKSLMFLVYMNRYATMKVLQIQTTGDEFFLLDNEIWRFLSHCSAKLFSLFDFFRMDFGEIFNVLQAVHISGTKWYAHIRQRQQNILDEYQMPSTNVWAIWSVSFSQCEVSIWVFMMYCIENFHTRNIIQLIFSFSRIKHCRRFNGQNHPIIPTDLLPQSLTSVLDRSHSMQLVIELEHLMIDGVYRLDEI